MTDRTRRCTKCKKPTSEGAWTATLTNEQTSGISVKETQCLCATCAAEFPDEEQRIAYVANVTEDRWNEVVARGDRHWGVVSALREHFTPCRHCGGKDITLNNRSQVRERRTTRVHRVVVGCKDCGRILLDVEDVGDVDLPAKILAQIQHSLPN